MLEGAKHNWGDFIFWREVRLGTYAADTHQNTATDYTGMVPRRETGPRWSRGNRIPARPFAAQIALRNPQMGCQYGERVPFLMVQGEGERVSDWLASPFDLLPDPTLRPHATYYCERHLIPALDRVLSLVGVEVRAWYRSLPKTISLHASTRIGSQARLERFLSRAACTVCHGRPIVLTMGQLKLCRGHLHPRQAIMALNQERIRLEQAMQGIQAECLATCGSLVNPRYLDPLDPDLCWAPECSAHWHLVAWRHYSLPRLQQIEQALDSYPD